METSKSNASDPFTTALRLLSGRDLSEAELRRKLAKFGFSASDIDSAIDKCHEYRYLDDQRYALARARSLAQSGKGVGRKIMLDLKQRGIDEATACQALEDIAAEIPPEQAMRDLLERRFSQFSYDQASDKERRRVVSYLQRRGFALDLIFTILRETHSEE